MAVVVYDITSKCSRTFSDKETHVCVFPLGKPSFTNVQRFIDDAKSIRGNDLLIILVGNKIDQAEKRQVTTDEGQALAKELNVLFIETSAKAGVNIKQLF